MRFLTGWRAAGLVAAGGCGFCATARPADAAIRVDERASLVNTSAFAQGGLFGLPDDDSDRKSTSSTTDNFTSLADAFAESSGVSGESEARQNTTPTYTGGNLSRVQGTGSVFVEVFASGGGEADATGTSDLLLRFNVPAGESYAFAFTGSLGDDSPRTNAVVYLYDVGRDTYRIDRSGNAGAFTAAGTLLPGNYEFNARAFGLASEFNTGSGNAQFSVDLTLTPVAIPEPAAASLLLALPAGLLARRHRRRRP